MADGFIVRRGGVGSEQALAPTITEISKTESEIVFTITNNDASTAVILYEVDDATPDANSIELAAAATTSNITVTGLASNTSFVVYATANVTGKVKSNVTSLTITTDEIVWYGDRGLFGGGFATANSDVIDFISIPTTGNATDFGDLTVARIDISSCSNGSRGVWGGAFTTVDSNVIDFVTIATTGNATDFGDLTVARRGLSACSDGTRGVFGGGSSSGTPSNVLDYITISTTGNAIDFGDLTTARAQVGACANATRGVWGGGSTFNANTVTGGNTNAIDFITIATTGNATTFGTTLASVRGLAACSDETRGIFGGGFAASLSNVLQFITINTTGNATDFGDLTQARNLISASSNGTRGVWAGGSNGSISNTIDFITIATTGNATDFGDLTVARERLASCSGN
jgi:hypothetical protein